MTEPTVTTGTPTAPAEPVAGFQATAVSSGPSTPVRDAAQGILWRVETDAAPLLAIVLGAVDLVTGARAGRAIDLGAIGAGFAALGLPLLGGRL